MITIKTSSYPFYPCFTRPPRVGTCRMAKIGVLIFALFTNSKLLVGSSNSPTSIINAINIFNLFCKVLLPSRCRCLGPRCVMIISDIHYNERHSFNNAVTATCVDDGYLVCDVLLLLVTDYTLDYLIYITVKCEIMYWHRTLNGIGRLL